MSGKDAVSKMMSNPVLTALMVALNTLFSYAGIISISLGSGVSCYFLLQYYPDLEINNIIAPIVVVMLIGYIIGTIFM